MAVSSGASRFVLALISFPIAALAALAAGCGDDGGTPASCLPGCPGDRGYDAVAYHLHARFDWATNTLHASEDIIVAPAASPVVALDAEVEVAGVHSERGPLAYAYDAEAHTLRVDLGPIADGANPARFTVDYTAPLSDSLLTGGARDGDPVTSRVVFTNSEPDRGLRWLVAKHDPADRALWTVDLTVDPAHDVIANGERTADEMIDGARRITHHLDQPIPTYLMAFAAGELDHRERTTGRFPVAVWFRRGLVVDADAHFGVIADAMAVFEDRLGPYPWSRYSVVLLPNFGGGMENATITFNAESSGQGAISFGLNAHELAHQWFGDWVTMRTYDDVWVKEGMATFLAAEATRATRDLGERGRLFGSDFIFWPGDAVVDPELTGLDKYTSGPYERAAWVITQLRVKVGEAAFWAGLRKILSDHAVGTITGDEFLRSFMPALDEPTRAQLADSLRLHTAATVAATSDNAAEPTITFHLDDSARTLIAPIELAVIAADGSATTRPLVSGTDVAVTVPIGGYLAPDERGVHPELPWVFDDANLYEVYFGAMVPHFTPVGSSPALAELGFRSSVHQERAMTGSAPLPPPVNFLAFYDDLDSLEARRAAVLAACAQRGALAPADQDALTAVITPLLQTPPIVRYGNFAACGTALPTQLFDAELALLAASSTAATAERLEYLLGFDYGPEANLEIIGRVAREAPSLRLRERALSRLQTQTNAFTSYTRLTATDQPAWRAFFAGQYALATSRSRLAVLWRASLNLVDVDALPALARALHAVPQAEAQQVRMICEAHGLALRSPGAWETFQQDTRPWSTLTPCAAVVLEDPAACASARPAPATDDDDAIDPFDPPYHDHVRFLRAAR